MRMRRLPGALSEDGSLAGISRSVTFRIRAESVVYTLNVTLRGVTATFTWWLRTPAIPPPAEIVWAPLQKRTPWRKPRRDWPDLEQDSHASNSAEQVAPCVAPYLDEMLSSPIARRFEDLAWHTSTPWLIRRCIPCRLSIVKSKSAAWFSLRPSATPRRCSNYCSF